MAVDYRILGQANTAGAITTYNTIAGPVATGRSWIVSTIVVCNQTASAQTYRLAVSGSTSPASSEFIVFGSTVPANDTVTLTLGITMQAGKYQLLPIRLQQHIQDQQMFILLILL